MNNQNAIVQVFTFFLYLLLQVLLVRNLVLFDVAFSYIYVAFLLLLPFETGKLTLMLLGFGTGIVLDIFYDTLGIHAAACVVMMYLRPYWVHLNTPRGGYEVGTGPVLKLLGMEWFARYAFALIFIHHLVLFFLEASGFQLFWLTLGKAFFSAIFTFVLLVLLQYLFYSPRRSI